MSQHSAALRADAPPAPVVTPAHLPLSLVEQPITDATGPLTIFEVPLPTARPAGLLGRLKSLLQRLGGMQLMAGKSRRMRVSETINLGEKRFVSLVEIDGVSLLIGGGSGSVQLLTQLGEGVAPRTFESEIESAWRKRGPA